MKKYAITILILSVIGIPPAFAAFSDVFLSRQVGTSVTNGDILTTDGTNSTWVTPGSLGFLTSYDPFSHPLSGWSATTTILRSAGFVSTASSTFQSTFRLPSLSDGGLAVYSGTVGSYATTTFNSPLNYSNGAVTLSTAGTWSGLAGTATALAANGTNCSAGNYPLGVDASGNSENCTAAGTGTLTSLTAGDGLLGGTITNSGTIYGQLGTSTLPVISNIPYFTSVGTASAPAKFANVATTSLTASGVLSLSNPISVIGSSASALTVTGGSNGQVLGWSAGLPTWLATSTFSVASSNGFAGSFTNATNPVLTISTSISGLLKGNGTAISAAALTDFPTQAANTFLVNRTGAVAAPTALATSSMFCASCATTIAYASSTAQSAPNIMATTNLSVGTTTPSTLFSIGNALTNGGLYFTTTGLGIGTSSPQFPFSVTPALSNLASTFYINSSGTLVGYDATNAWAGRISPTKGFGMQTGTTTSWTASTTGSAYSPFWIATYAGTIQQVRCSTDASFLGVNVQIAGSSVTPSYFVASTTVGTEKFTAGNTFTAGQKVLVDFGTTTTATAKSISCSFDTTESI